MSAIIKDNSNTSIRNWGIAKYQVTVQVLVHSHSGNAPIYLSQDCTNISMSKNGKGAGQATLSLTASKNYLNILFPNDYINIYVDVGDGRGWTRTFFGLIDRIEETYSTDDSGTPTTTYEVACTDFTKIVARTEVYFNPQISLRRDLNGLPFGTLNVGGLALMTSGIVVFGSPDTIVTTNLILTLGFGSQFAMPASYPVPSAIIRQARADRQRAALRLVQSKISPTDYNAKKAEIQASAQTEAQSLIQNSSPEQIVNTLLQKYGLNINNVEVQRVAKTQDQSALAALISDQQLRKLLNINQSIGADVNTFLAMDRTANANQKPSIMDYIDIFSFVEREAMDGYTASASIYQQQGPIQSFLTSYSNEMVNEMFFDLRPRHNKDFDNTFQYAPSVFTSYASDDWSTEPDDIGGNVTAQGNGIQYVPALVMREYPFSTIGQLDASNIPISISSRAPTTSIDASGKKQETAANTVQTVGNVFMGASFSHAPNTPGRHYISSPNINVEDIASNSGVKFGRKIIDVAVISEKEIKSSKFGRSDEDHVNLTEVWADGPLGQDAKWYMQDLSPVVTPIHIMRHGLRRRTLSTLFCRYDRAAVQNTAPTQAQTPTDNTPQAQQPANQIQQADGSTATIPPGSVIWPAVTSDLSKRALKYGYRLESNVANYYFDSSGNRVDPSTPGAIKPAQVWDYHHGVDIQGTRGTPVVAAMDGEIVVVGLQGMYSRYGNIVVIKHTSPIRGYTVYAHLDTIATNVVDPVLEMMNTLGLPVNTNDPAENSRRKIARITKGLGVARSQNANGTMTSIPVRAGQQIGTIGGTDDLGRSYGAHLHFEFDVSFPPNAPLKGKTPNNPGSIPIFSGDLSSTDPKISAASANASIKSRNPYLALNLKNAPHARQINSNVAATDIVDASEANDDSDDTDLRGLPNDQLNNPTTATAPDGSASTNPNITADQVQSSPVAVSPVNSGIVPVVDSINSRRQLARWILLQDHWYQHNTEYLSGTIEVSPHPEIRVGYRLDIYEKNLSFYVEGVAHNWQVNQGMSTVLTVTRGQPNNPFPAYIHPATDGFSPTNNQRSIGSRLDEYFIMPDPVAIRNFYALRQDSNIDEFHVSLNNNSVSPDTNIMDTDDHIKGNEQYTSSQTDFVYDDSAQDLDSRLTIDESFNTGRNNGVSGTGGVTQQGAIPTAVV